jgi:hypothetical protein
MSKLPVLLAILVVASMTAPALAAGGPPTCYHLRCDNAPLQIQAPPVPHPSGRDRG